MLAGGRILREEVGVQFGDQRAGVGRVGAFPSDGNIVHEFKIPYSIISGWVGSGSESARPAQDSRRLERHPAIRFFPPA